MICRSCNCAIRRNAKETPAQIGDNFWHPECVRAEIKRRAIRAGCSEEKAEQLSYLWQEKDTPDEQGIFRRGQTFRFKLGYMPGVIAKARKLAACDLCGFPIGRLKGRIPWVRVKDGERTYGQVSLCLACVGSYAAEPLKRGAK